MCECVSFAISPSLLPSLCLSFKVLGDIELAQNMQSEKHQVAKDVSITVVNNGFMYYAVCSTLVGCGVVVQGN